VKNGGTLVALAQQHGYDWGLLPAPVDPETREKMPVGPAESLGQVRHSDIETDNIFAAYGNLDESGIAFL
jgi:hypothetical protein